jgi:hypothetical protein
MGKQIATAGANGQAQGVVIDEVSFLFLLKISQADFVISTAIAERSPVIAFRGTDELKF